MERYKLKSIGIILVIFGVGVLYYVSVYLPKEDSGVEGSVTSFAGCVAAGGKIIESYPRTCTFNEGSFVEALDLPQPTQNEETLYYSCLGEAKGDDVLCTTQYDPVCASVDVECITEPCNPVLQTFSNSCEACKSERTNYYFKGECF